jgi:hypothetical protein
MASEIKANKISPATGTAFTLGDSGDTFTLPSGATLAVASGAAISNAGTASGFGGTNTPAFFATKTSADQGVSHNVYTKVTFDTEEIDTDSAFDLANDKFTVPVGKAGKYILNGNVTGHSTGGDLSIVVVAFYINGSIKNSWRSLYEVPLYNNSTECTINATVIADLAEGDYVELYGRVGGDGTTTLNIKLNKTYFSGFKLVE